MRRKYRFSMRRNYRRRRNNNIIKFLKAVLFIIIALAIVYFGFISAKFIKKIISGDEKKPSSFEISNETDDNNIETKIYASSLYVPSENINQISSTIKTAKEKNFNSIIIEIKDKNGNLYYKTKNSTVLASEAISAHAVDLKQIVDEAKKENINIGVKIHCFKDNTAPKKIPQAGIGVRKGYLWIDAKNSRWLNPYYTEASDYLCAIVSDVVSSGVSQILLDSVEFPSVGKTSIIEYEKNKPEKSKQQALIDFVKSVKTKAGSEVEVGIFSPAESVFDKKNNNEKTGEGFDLCNSADFTVLDFTADSLADYKDVLGEATDLAVKALDKVKVNMQLSKIMPIIDENDHNVIIQNKCRGYILNNIIK